MSLPAHDGASTPTSFSSLLAADTPYGKSMQRTNSINSLNSDNPYPTLSKSHNSGLSRLSGNISEKFSLSPDPRHWGSNLSPDFAEADDDIHNPDHVPVVNGRPAKHAGRHLTSDNGAVFSARGLANVGCLVILCVGIVTLFAGYPIITALTRDDLSNNGAFNIGGINATGQIPSLTGNFGLIDEETPHSAYTVPAWNQNGAWAGQEMDLVFSDEFNLDGRTFYPGDDPYWEAVDLHYWATNNLEWYDPAAITTKNGSLVITLEQKETHNLNYQGGMMSTWNKFCFTGGYIEVSVQLPGLNNVAGLWPAVWTMGNLGRAGYGASLEGMWPYTYDACDVGTVANQSVNGNPPAAMVNGDPSANGELSYLPGQRLSRCSCPNLIAGESHPGPKHSDGSWVGRAAPEIDIFEAQIGALLTGPDGTTYPLGEGPKGGQVSQSAQWAPFNAAYVWQNSSANEIFANPGISYQNGYTGSSTQQATSVVTQTNQQCYEGDGQCFSVYGFEYKPGFDNGYITWISSGTPSWTLNAAGMGPDQLVQISARPVPQEPLYIIMNLGMSENFGKVDIAHLPFPVHMYVDYVRVYQPKGQRNVGCDPKDFPTQSYINQYMEAYTNPNLTTWRNDFGQNFLRNSFLGQC
ncbi:glycoside hydrolase family 16 protein [Dentipellis sp. KUC8613]|nr:glycoside hydrolase family 16 protein [Dentipellis sp. KUC8613]